MKKITSLILILIFIVSCSNNKDCFVKYQQAFSNFQNVESYKSNFTSKIVLSQNNSKLNENVMNYTRYEVKNSDGSFTGLLEQSFKFEEIDYLSSNWFVDGISYYSGFSEPISKTMSYENFKSQYTYDGFLDFKEDAILKQTSKGKSITFELDKDYPSINEFLLNELSLLESSIEIADIKSLEYDFRDIKYSLVLDNSNNIVSTNLVYTIDIKSNFNISLDYEVNMILGSVNETIIELPKNYEMFNSFD